MAYYCWIVRAYSQRDHGCVRALGRFPDQPNAWMAVIGMCDLMVNSGDYCAQRTIVLKEPRGGLFEFGFPDIKILS